jgi:hypothetical protein
MILGLFANEDEGNSSLHLHLEHKTYEDSDTQPYKCTTGLLLLLFISNQKEYNLQTNVMIIQVGYDSVYYYDLVGYSSSDVTSGALQV